MVNVVVVDDEERIRQGLAKLITQAGDEFHVVGIFSSGMELLSQMDKLSFDLIITDIKMPKMTGLELIEKLQGSLRNFKVAIVSGFDDFSYARQALRYGVEEYLLKPVDKVELERLLYKVKADLDKNKLKQQLTHENHIRLLLYNDNELLPTHLKLEAGSALDFTPFFQKPYVVFVIRGNPKLTEKSIQDASMSLLTNWRMFEHEDQLTLIVGLNSSDHADRAREIGQTLLTRLPFGFEGRMGGSDVFTGTSWLRQAFRQAEFALQNAWYDEGRKIFVDYSHIPKKQSSLSHLIMLLDREFQEALTMLDYTRAQVAVERWFAECIALKPTWSELREGCETVLELLRRFGTQHTTINVNSEHIVSCDPVLHKDRQSFSLYFLNVVKDFLREMQETRQENRVVDTVKTYIMRHYTEELELNRLAEEVYLTPSYLSKLFKTEAGETITEFLISIRIDHAKELLREHKEYKTYEIGEKVGYPDPAYFNKVFKKVVGCTPKEFRDRVR
ncbi:MAG: response regulator [Candidatus Cohnella colombiensis]|uniref:Response regulator n=1 Tax=Candidatus Cohnella colombiensis TaxID=3121368 RepID=A0AA95F5W3_9BACL|nr:MAG: response regulator [Cohnella sp.]